VVGQLLERTAYRWIGNVSTGSHRSVVHYVVVLVVVVSAELVVVVVVACGSFVVQFDDCVSML